MLRRCLLQSARASARWSSSTPVRPTVQVLHHNPPAQPYAQVEQDIAAMQREIRDAYKCVHRVIRSNVCVCVDTKTN